MAVVKALKGGRSLSKALDYAAKDEITHGINVNDDPKKAYQEISATKAAWGKTDGRQYKHYVQSFKPGEVTAEQAQKIGVQLAKEEFPGHEVLVGTHIDKDHVHNHFIVNSVNYENGKKLHLGNKFLEQMKSRSDEICRENGLSVVDRTQTPEAGQVRTYDMNKYQAMAQGKSYVAAAYIAVDQALEASKGKGFDEFQKNLESQGYSVKLRGEKHITFADPDGNKIRGSNLAKTFSDDSKNRENIMQTLGVDKQVEKQLSAKTLPKMKTVQDIKGETSRIAASPTQAPAKSKSPSRSGGGSGIAGTGKMSLYDLIEQGFSEEQAQKILDTDGLSIKISGGSTEGITTDIIRAGRKHGRER